MSCMSGIVTGGEGVEKSKKFAVIICTCLLRHRNRKSCHRFGTLKQSSLYTQISDRDDKSDMPGCPSDRKPTNSKGSFAFGLFYQRSPHSLIPIRIRSPKARGLARSLGPSSLNAFHDLFPHFLCMMWTDAETAFHHSTTRNCVQSPVSDCLSTLISFSVEISK